MNYQIAMVHMYGRRLVASFQSQVLRLYKRTSNTPRAGGSWFILAHVLSLNASYRQVGVTALHAL